MLLAVLAVLSMTVVRSIREKSQEIACVGKLRAMGAAIPLFAGDHGGYLPVAINNEGVLLNSPNYGTWAVALLPYMTDCKLGNNRTTNSQKIKGYADYFRCPADKEFRADYDQTWSYGWNMACGNSPKGKNATTDYPKIRLASFPSPGRIFAVADAYHYNAEGYNYGTAGTDASGNAPVANSPRSHFRHPVSDRALTEAEILSGPPRRNILHLDGHVAKRILTTNDTWRHLLEAADLINWDVNAWKQQ